MKCQPNFSQYLSALSVEVRQDQSFVLGYLLQYSSDFSTDFNLDSIFAMSFRLQVKTTWLTLTPKVSSKQVLMSKGRGKKSLVCCIKLLTGIALCLNFCFVYFSGSALEMYLFQEVEKPEMGFANHKFIQLWTGRVPVGHESCL